MKWEDISEASRKTMAELGEFSPTTNPGDRMVKGAMFDEELGFSCNVYYNSYDLRHIAAACNEVAEWLDNRAEMLGSAGR